MSLKLSTGTLSDADVTELSLELFPTRRPRPSKLGVPVNTTGTLDLEPKLRAIRTDPRLKDIGIGVVDFTDDAHNPKVWLHKPADGWLIGSTAKISILLAAVQLRDDVRRVADFLQAKGKLANNEDDAKRDFDVIFSNVWRERYHEIAGPTHCPRPSTIFDLSPPTDRSSINFLGAGAPGSTMTADWQRLRDLHNEGEKWESMPKVTFWERLWLIGHMSDNVAASATMSEIGVSYLKAVQSTYGLFTPEALWSATEGMHLLLAGHYRRVDSKAQKTRVSTDPNAPFFRALKNEEANPVKDPDNPSNPTDRHLSSQPGSANALTAYMIALMQDRFIDREACDTIRFHLSARPWTIFSLTQESIDAKMEDFKKKDVAHADEYGITEIYHKVGIKGILRAEFAYLGINAFPNATPARSKTKFGLVAAGIIPWGGIIDGQKQKFNQVDQGHYLAAVVYDLLTL